jgi:hypothetical protein
VRGWRTPLTDNAVWDVRPADRTRPLVNTFYRAWLHSSAARPAAAAHCPPEPAAAGRDRSTEWSNVKQYKEADHVTEKTPLLGGKDAGNWSVDGGRSGRHMETWATQSSLLLAVCRSFGLYYGLMGIYEVFTIALTFARPVLLK